MVSKRFLLKRLLLLVPVLFGVGTFVFAILQLAPGNPCRVILGVRADDAQIQRCVQDLGLDDPIWIQYLRFLADAAQFDFGNSYSVRQGVPVRRILENRLMVTLELAVLGQFVGIALGIPLGVISAVKQDTIVDQLGRIGALTGISVPIYWSGPLLILLFATPPLAILPASGRIGTFFEGTDYTAHTGLILVDTLVSGNMEAFVSAAQHLFLPVMVIGIYSMALISRMMRSSMLEVIRQDYIRTARAKGQGEKITLMKHGFRNALIPVVTVIGIQFGTLLGGAVLTETVFAINGMGTAIVSAISDSDFPVVQGTVLTFALLFTVVNLGVDVTYNYLDPRIDQ